MEKRALHSNPLECPICYDLLDNAFETYCGHSFCEYCINKALENSNVCPLCRTNPSPIHPSYTLRSLVDQERHRLGLLSDLPQHDPLDYIRETYQGNLAYKMRQYAEAIKHYTVANSIQPSAVSHGNRGASYFKLKQFRLALEDYLKAEQLDPYNVRLQIGKALTLEKLFEYRESFATFQRALKMQPTGSNRDDVINGIKRLLPYVTIPTAVTTITTTHVAPLSYEQATFQTWQLNQDLIFKEFLGISNYVAMM
jgi:tetratricopeptide (TPR) repeat protein